MFLTNWFRSVRKRVCRLARESRLLCSWLPAKNGTIRRMTSRLAVETLEDRTVPTSTIHGSLFEDMNGDGVRDGGDSNLALAGVTVYMDQNQNGVRDVGETSTNTNANGEFSFSGLAAGTYLVTQEVTGGYAQTSPGPLAGPDTLGEVLASFARPEPGDGNYAGLAWADNEFYVTQTRQGNVADNVMYHVNPVTGEVIGSPIEIPEKIGEIAFDGTYFWGADYVNNLLIQFDSSGAEQQRFSFASGVRVFGVEWDGQSLWMNALDKIHEVDSADGSILQTFDSPDGNNGGIAYDGKLLWVNGRDTDRVYAIDPATGEVVRSFASPGDFAYGLAYHDNRLWLSDSSLSDIFEFDIAVPASVAVMLDGTNDVSGVEFGNFQLASVSGRVFNDIDQDGAQDAAEIGLSDRRVFVDDNGNGTHESWERSAVTDALGDYSIGGLRAGTHSVVEDLAGYGQPRWSPTLPTSGVHSATVTTSGEAFSGKNFGNFLDRTTPIAADEWGTFGGGQMNLYTGLSWADFSGLLPEPTFDGAVAYAANSTYAGYDDWRLPTKTEAQYAAVNGVGPRLNAGAYASPSFHWWTSTTSTKQRVWAVALHDPNGDAYEAGKGGHHPHAGIRDTGIIIDDGATGYSTSGFSAKTTNGAHQGDQSTAAKGTGSKTATWTFTGLEAGATYKVDVTWKPVSGAATNAPFTVLDGTTVVGTSSLNQSVAPNDFTVGDYGWEGLGAYTISGNTLSVKLSNLANGTVIADAVRIFKVLPSYAPAAALLAASVPADASAAATIASTDMQPLLAEALRRWQVAGTDTSSLGQIDLRIADLGGATLGLASGNTIWLDDNAAGWGWFVDPTPWDDSEFTTPGDQGEQARMDLLSVLEHELGHLLGFDHEEGGVMEESLAAGTRATDLTLVDAAMTDWLFADEKSPLRRKSS